MVEGRDPGRDEERKGERKPRKWGSSQRGKQGRKEWKNRRYKGRDEKEISTQNIN